MSYTIIDKFQDIFGALPTLTITVKGQRTAMVLAAATAWLWLATPLAAKEASTPPAPPTQSPAQAALPSGQSALNPPETREGTTSGLPVPRFVSLKSSRINVRRGPGPDNQILWVFKKKGLPVEITAESGRWRRIRDHDGDVGWVWHSMLDGRRGALVTGRKGNNNPIALFTEPSEKSPVVAYVEIGVVARMPFCQDKWCELQVNGYEGWVQRRDVWGTYPGENFE